MRIFPWLAALSSVLMLLAGGESSAQSPRHSSGMSYEEALAGRAQISSEDSEGLKLAVRGQSGPPMYGPGGGPGPGGGFTPAYGNNNPAAIWPPNTPASYQPYPAISPYYQPNVAQDTTYNDRGLWFRNILHRRRDYFFTVEYLLTGYRDPGNHTIGERPIPVRLFDNSPQGFIIDNYGLGGPAEFGPGGGTSLTADQRVIVGPGVLPYPAIFLTEGDELRTLVDSSFAFPVRTLDLFNNPVEADGIRSRWGYENENGTGMMLTGWYGGLGQERFQLGRDHWNTIPITQDLILANTPDSGFAPIFPRNGVLPLEYAEGFLSGIANDQETGEFSYGFTGASQKFDVLFQVDVETRAFGATLNMYHEPIFKNGIVSVRPTFGARYVYVDDRFAFRGIDSGLNYTVDATGGGGGGGGGGAGGGGAGGGGTGGGGAGGGTGQGTAPTYRPIGSTVHVPLDPNDNPIPLFFEANLKSGVDSHLAGPEAGLRYDFGEGKNFSIWGQSTIALLANNERVRVAGQNIGDPLDVFLTTFNPVTGTGVNFTDPSVDTTFVDTDTHTHASPMFEQSLFMEANILRYVPLINQVHLLEQAQFQMGYTWTVIGQMARAGESIKWKAFPDTPYVNIDYKTWSMSTLSFGINWNY